MNQINNNNNKNQVPDLTKYKGQGKDNISHVYKFQTKIIYFN